MATNGSYDIDGMRKGATDIEGYMETYKSNREKMIEIVENTTAYWEDPINKDYIKKFEDLKQDMLSVENLMRTYAEYLRKSAKLIEVETSI